MADYTYTGIGKDGKKIEGKKRAQNKSELLDSLNSQGLTVLSIREDYGFNFRKTFSRDIGGLPLSEKVLISKQIATMISAGIPVIQIIGILIDQQNKQSMKEKFQEVYRKVESGFSLSEAFRSAGGIFNEVQINLISAGEKSGNLNVMLNKVADDLEKSKNLRGKIVGALIYPAIIFLILLVVMSVMILFMVPQIQELYASLGKSDLPIVTQVLVNVGNFMSSPLFLVTLIIAIVSIVVGYRYYVADESRKLVLDRLKLKMPVFGKLSRKIELTEFCRITSMLTNSGVPILEALRIVTKAMSNLEYQNILSKSLEDVAKGTNLSIAIAKNNVNDAFPSILIKIISTGEESGNLDKVLQDMYLYYEAEVEQITGNLTKLLEPFILVLVGVMVAFLAVAIYLPIYGVGNTPALS